MDNPLDAVAVRVLGSLIEKESTTPDNYPLTVNALTSACNQTTNREPVMELDENAVLDALRELTRRGLVHEVHRSDSRAKRYRHVLGDKLSLHQAEAAALGVLLLRGPQTAGEIRTRAARMFEFIDIRHVEVTLDALMTMTEPLAVQLPRHPGQKEVRYAHLMAGEPEMPVATSARPTRSEAEDRVGALEQQVADLRTQLDALQASFDKFREQFQ